jgi:hypothetical protein
MLRKLRMRSLSLLLSPLIATNPVSAQKEAIGSTQSSPHTTLHVTILDLPSIGLASSNSINGYAIKVTDSSAYPTASAAAALRFSDGGFTDDFLADLKAWGVFTGATGIARFPAFQWESTLVELRVMATKGSPHAGVVLRQTVGQKQPRTVSSSALTQSTVVTLQLPPAPEFPLEMPQPDGITAELADAVPMIVRNWMATPSDNGQIVPGTPATAQTHASASEPENTTSRTGSSLHGARKKFLLIAAIGAAAGVGAMVMLLAHGGGGTSNPSGVTIGAPTISVNH